MHPAARLGSADAPRWLLLIHQIPPKPAYFRAKVGRRLARLGSVAIKNSVYALPRTSQSREDFQWLAREIVSDGGEATLCEASLIEGLRDEQVEALFLAARDADYSAVSEEARGVARTLPAKLARDDERRGQIENDVGRWEKRLAEIVTIDFFGAEGRETAEAAVLSVQKRLRQKEREPAAERPGGADASAYQGRTWTTRSNVGVDRIASAWLIKRFIDPGAVFSFVAAKGRPPALGEISFDMFEATFTHVGDRCTFEVLLEQFALSAPGLIPLAEIVHDIDVKDAKFGRPETAGIAGVVAGIALAQRDDEARIAVGSALLDALLAHFAATRGRTPGAKP
jgi:hypothetical protein